MRRMSFERPTDHYDERILTIDEQICALLKRRKELSNNDPGFPPLEYISNWADKFDLQEEFLQLLFGVIRNDEDYRPFIEPVGFRKQIPVLKSVEKEEYFYSITMIRQYENASVVYLHIDGEPLFDDVHEQPNHGFLDLFIEGGYDCRSIGGSGSDGHFTHRFTVSPPLPDDFAGLDLVFKTYNEFNGDNPFNLEVVIHID